MGVEAVPLDMLAERAPELDMIVSCASTLLVNEDILKRLPQHAVVVDIAATPAPSTSRRPSASAFVPSGRAVLATAPQ